MALRMGIVCPISVLSLVLRQTKRPFPKNLSLSVLHKSEDKRIERKKKIALGSTSRQLVVEECARLPFQWVIHDLSQTTS